MSNSRTARLRLRIRDLIPGAALLALAGCGAAGSGSGLAPEPAGPPSLAERVDALLAEPPFNGMHWGILVGDAASGATLYARNPGVHFIPASNMKLPATAAALGLLGPDYRWDTAFYATDATEEGVLGGDLVLVGSGDPTLGAPFYDPPEAALTALVDSLRAAGVLRIEGGLVLDASAWDSATAPGTWMLEDVAGMAGATGGVFAVRQGALEIWIRGASIVGEPATLSWQPWGGRAFVEGRIETTPPGTFPSVDRAFLPESRRWVVTGSVPTGDSLRVLVPQRDPVRLAWDALQRALEEGGVEVGGESRIVWEAGALLEAGCRSATIPSCPAARRVAGIRSPPLREVARLILSESHNWSAEQLLRTLGAEHGGEGSWRAGLEAAVAYLEEEVGVSPLDLDVRDGSGLTANGLLTPRAVVRILDFAREQSWGAQFRASLAQPDVEDSTLESRLPGMEGRVFAKTGTIRHVNSLSGYVVTAGGRELVFSILTNGSNLPSSEVRGRIDRLVREIAEP
ncbi:MAG: D-alanyl-D-alanine carboxypeptidase/D-alanyl-D-alanine-endopeptidase [Gemmatimonadota bacterium]